jgi:hypothetical protein
MLQKKPGTRFEGYNFSAPSKQKLMEGLAVAIQSRSITVIAPNAQMVKSVQHQEMESFEYQYTRTGVRYSAPDGYHDDAVCSLALANEHRSGAIMPMAITPDILARSRQAVRRPGVFVGR